MPQKVVVGIDGSEVSRDAFHEAVRQAEWRGCGVTALHTVPFPIFTQYDIAVVDPAVIITHGKAFVQREIEQLEATYADGFPVPVDTLVLQGHAGLCLTEAASSQDADSEGAELVVLGSRGYGGIRGPLVGSVTTYAVHHLTCPLLIIPPREED